MMASAELNVDIDEEEKKWNAEAWDGPPFDSPSAPLCNKPLDYTQVTPSQLGISTQSFVPSSLGKDKSRLTQLKARRRSTIGARGSPETNSLIRHIAQLRLKTPPSTPRPPASPFLSRGFSSLKQKMAAFQNLLETEEDLGPEEVREADGLTSVGGKENRGPQRGPLPAPPSSKKRRTAPFREIVAETGEAAPSVDILSPLLTPGCPEQVCPEQVEELQVELRQQCSEGPSYAELTTCALEEAVCCSPPRFPTPWSRGRNSAPFTPEQGTPTAARRRTPLTGPLSPCMRLNLALVDTGSSESPPPLTAHPTDGAPDGAASSVRAKKKRVRFGVPLPPEFFDKTLPPSTPLRRGGTPAPLSASGGGSQLRSLLKAPQGCALSIPQPDFDCPSLSGPSSPPPSDGLGNEVQTVSTEQEQLVVPEVIPGAAKEEEEEEEEKASSSREDAACSPDVAPTPHEEMVRPESRSPDATPVPPLTPSREAETGDEPKTELSPTPGLSPAPGSIPAPEPPVSAGRPRSRKRKVEETEPAVRRRPSRSAAVTASGKMRTKASAAKRGWGSKPVDRSLYGKRAYASKNPALSPITESLSGTCRYRPPLRPRAAKGLPEDCGDTRSPSIPLALTGLSGPEAYLLQAAALWRSRFCTLSPDRAPDDHPDDHKAEEDARCPTDDPSVCPGVDPSVCPGVDPSNCPVDNPSACPTDDPTACPTDDPTACPTDDPSVCPGVDPSDCPIDDPSDCPLDDPSDHTAEAESTVSTHSQERRRGRPARPRGGRGGKGGRAGRGKGTREPALTSQNSDDQTVIAVEPELPVCGPTEHDRFPGDRQESDIDGLRGEEELRGDERGVGEGTASEPDAGGGAPEAVGESVRRSNAGRRSGAKGKSKGRRSSIYRPLYLIEEDEEAQSLQTLLLSVADQSEGDGAVRGGAGGEVSDTAMEEGSGPSVKDGAVIRPPAVPPVTPPQPQPPPGVDLAEVTLPPWQQAEFSIDEVLQAPLPSGGRRSVRRSLRNQSCQDPSASGLAWVAGSPPAEIASTRRRTRGRRSAAHVLPALPDDPSPLKHSIKT